MNKLLIYILVFVLFVSFSKSAFAVYDPITFQNNKYGIHILFPEEIGEAAHLINSSGGDWGYVTIPIRASDKNLEKWQKFMDDCARLHVIPLVRIATEGDYFTEGSWEIPSNYYIIDFANFLNSLNWPTKNRYVIIFNETNRGDEWGGIPDPREYAKILDYAVETFKQRSDKFFIIMGGLDNASVDIYLKSVNQFNYMRQMDEEIPGIFGKIDGLAVHAYPNPAFSSSPYYLGVNGIFSFNYEQDLVKELTGKKLPIFITETGWSSDSISLETQSNYYKQAFSNAWNDENIVAVTPFIFQSEQGPFRQFSFIKDNKKTTLYESYLNFSKIKGQPQIEPQTLQTVVKSVVLKTKFFSDELTKNLYNIVNTRAKNFFKWLLNI
ncbi:MAG: hypothetical protein A2171_02625 [Candidatus Levybacteria bacterium RBG_13_35_9]|nr:MAG: hypothetical protein A2171_02625 [Candidatus Levybacteria bacterium RBG_13_35_9]